MNLQEFDWGNTNEWYREIIKDEIFENRIYEKLFKVSEGDIVVDFGASIGPFGYTLRDRGISHLYSFEPSFMFLPILNKNLENIPNTIIPKAISDVDGLSESFVFLDEQGQNFEVPSMTFKNFINTFKIEKIDFLKTDCEGGEYNIFNIENMHWLKQNLGYAVGEWHLNSEETKRKFREFRDVFLRIFPNHHVYSVDGVDIKWDLWNEHFIEYYTEVIIHIDNKS